MNSKIAEQIKDLMTDTNKSAPDMTHAIKVLGDGNMQKGLSVIGEFFEEENVITAQESLKEGMHKGTIAGSLITLGIAASITAGIKIYKHFSKSKKKIKEDHEAKGQKILDTLNTASSENPLK